MTPIEWLIDQLEENGINHLDLAYEVIQKAKEMYEQERKTLYTEEQVREAIDRARNYNDGWVETENEIIKSLKQPKKD
jgi:hypothetical protein